MRGAPRGGSWENPNWLEQAAGSKDIPPTFTSTQSLRTGASVECGSLTKSPCPSFGDRGKGGGHGHRPRTQEPQKLAGIRKDPPGAIFRRCPAFWPPEQSRWWWCFPFPQAMSLVGAAPGGLGSRVQKITPLQKHGRPVTRVPSWGCRLTACLGVTSSPREWGFALFDLSMIDWAQRPPSRPRTGQMQVIPRKHTEDICLMEEVTQRLGSAVPSDVDQS